MRLRAMVSIVMPFGGAKQSSIGVEFGQEDLQEFTHIQVINQAR